MKRPTPAEWEYVGTSWREPESAGWDDASIVRTQLAKWPEFVSGVVEPNPISHIPGPGGRLATDDDFRLHNTAMAFAYVLGRAGHLRDEISILDWGGGLGQYAVLARTLLPALVVHYSCRDLPRMAAAGRTVLPADQYYDSNDHLTGKTFDLVIASGSLQYSPDWRTTLGTLAAATGHYLYVTRLPILLDTPSFVVVQRPHRHGYDTEYSGWFLNRNEFLDAARSNNLRLVREFLIMERHHAEGAPGDADSRGYLFEAPREEPI